MKEIKVHQIKEAFPMNGEEWAQYDGFGGRYFVSTEGRVATTFGVKIKLLSPSRSGAGYLKVTLCINAKFSYPTLHRLVAKTFIPNPKQHNEVNHIDGNKKNNRATNLEWVDKGTNMWHAVASGLKNDKGGNHPHSKKIINSKNGQVFNSMIEAANHLGVDRTSLSYYLRKNNSLTTMRYYNETK